MEDGRWGMMVVRDKKEAVPQCIPYLDTRSPSCILLRHLLVLIHSELPAMPASAAEYFFLIPSLAISLAIVVPLAGVLVRFRASYNPRGLALDSEGSAVPHTGPVVSSYFGMLRRVWQIEGFSGFYKGLSMLSPASLTLANQLI
jgi:hypothetical protein